MPYMHATVAMQMEAATDKEVSATVKRLEAAVAELAKEFPQVEMQFEVDHDLETEEETEEETA